MQEAIELAGLGCGVAAATLALGAAGGLAAMCVALLCVAYRMQAH